MKVLLAMGLLVLTLSTQAFAQSKPTACFEHSWVISSIDNPDLVKMAAQQIQQIGPILELASQSERMFSVNYRPQKNVVEDKQLLTKIFSIFAARGLLIECNVVTID